MIGFPWDLHDVPLYKIEGSEQKSPRFVQDEAIDYLSEGNIETCPTCGWWILWYQSQRKGHYEGGSVTHRQIVHSAWGVLKHLDSTPDMDLRLNEIRNYLQQKDEKRFEVHPKTLEEVVGAVFRDCGFESTVTLYSRDGGIDVILVERGSGKRIGVQVKRNRPKIGVEQINSFLGALMQGGYDQGIFITTSSYTSGAVKAARHAGVLGCEIELLDGPGLCERLRIARREVYSEPSDPSTLFFHLIQHPEDVPPVILTGFGYCAW